MNTAFAVRESQQATVSAGRSTVLSIRSPAGATMLLRDQSYIPVSVHSYTNLLFLQAAEAVSVSTESKAVQKLAPAVQIAPTERGGMITILAGQRGQEGPQGIPGPAGGTAVARVAGETLSALRVVYEVDGEVFLLDSTDDVHIDQLLGLTITSGAASENVNVQLVGAVDDASWSWTPGRVYLGASGFLTQTPPDAGYLVLVGYAVSATRLVLNIQDNIEL